MKRIDYAELCDGFYEELLPNGLRVRVLPRPGFARKFAFLAVDFGSNDRDFTLDGQKFHVPAGIAHYLEHKMFDLPEGGAMEQFAAHGGGNNAFTNYSMTAYYVECTEEFEENLKILLRMVTTPYFTPESVEKERGIIAQEIKMYADSPDSAVFEDLFAVMYPKHPISVPIAGSVESIADITPELLYACCRAFYTPQNMMLCVVGDVSAEEVARLAREFTPAPVPGGVRDESGWSGAFSCGTMEKTMEVAMPMFAAGFASDPIAPEASLRAEIVGDLAAEVLVGESSPLYQRLYEKNLIDSDFSCGFEQVRGVGLLELSGDSEAPDTVIDAVVDEAERIVREGVDAAQLERLRRSMIGRRTRELDSFESTCYRMSAYFFEGAEYFDSVRTIQSVTVQDITDFLRTVCRRDRLSVSYIRPKEA